MWITLCVDHDTILVAVNPLLLYFMIETLSLRMVLVYSVILTAIAVGIVAWCQYYVNRPVRKMQLHHYVKRLRETNCVDAVFFYLDGRFISHFYGEPLQKCGLKNLFEFHQIATRSLDGAYRDCLNRLEILIASNTIENWHCTDPDAEKIRKEIALLEALKLDLADRQDMLLSLKPENTPFASSPREEAMALA
jgi:hypothetical protein